MGRLQDRMGRELRIRGYAENTRKSYIGASQGRAVARFAPQRRRRPPPSQKTVSASPPSSTNDTSSTWITSVAPALRPCFRPGTHDYLASRDSAAGSRCRPGGVRCKPNALDPSTRIRTVAIAR